MYSNNRQVDEMEYAETTERRPTDRAAPGSLTMAQLKLGDFIWDIE